MRTLASVVALALLLPLAGCAKKSFKTFTPAEGGYSVLLPGTPKRMVQNEYGLTMTTYEGVRGADSYATSSGTVPPGGFDLDGAVWGLAEKTGATGTRSNGENRGRDGWREFELEAGKRFYSGRVLVARGRFYVALAAGPDARLSNAEVRAFVDSFRLSDGDTPGPADWPTRTAPTPITPTRPPADPTPLPPNPDPLPPDPTPAPRQTLSPTPYKAETPEETMAGHSLDPAFRDEAPAGGLLVGFDVWYGKFFENDVVWGVRPIYRKDGTDTLGGFYGTDTKRGVRVMAKPGYAVGGVTVRTGLGVDAITVTFMKVSGDRLDPTDAYSSARMGGPGGGDTTIGGTGAPVSGIVGRKNPNLSAFGLAYRK